MDTLTTASLPEAMRAPGLPEKAAPKPARVLTCEHGVACEKCVLEAARAIVEHDATLVGRVYTG